MKVLNIFFATAVLFVSQLAHAERIKDITEIQGVRSNQLVRTP